MKLKRAQKNTFYHLLAIMIVAVWGITFISTKVLIEENFTPQEIFFLRFSIAYIGIWFISPRRIRCKTWVDEFWLFLGGITGGSVYFLTENTALGITMASNVSFIVCTVPLLTAMLSITIYRQEKTTKRLLTGSSLALFGVALVVFNGSFILKISPLGDLLSLTAALSWAFYSLIMKKMAGRYPTIFITRKIFFYGVLTILPVFCIQPLHFSPHKFAHPTVLFNFLFLGIVASLLCYAMWNVVLKRLGTVRASNYIYLNPVFTLAGSSIILHEHLTWLSFIGICSILFGVYWASWTR